MINQLITTTIPVLILVLTVPAGLSIVVWTVLCGAPPMPSSGKARSAIVSALKTEGNYRCLAELGSGWGGVARALADTMPNSEILGIEISLVPFLFAWTLQWIQRKPNLKFRFANFKKVDLGEFKGVVAYLSPQNMNELAGKLGTELKPGSTIVSNTFALPGWTPKERHEISDMYRSKLYVYRVPYVSGKHSTTPTP